eukprot:TRINITY_DN3054_c0_g1_i1.p1 TRINITY_DN3054_c0_g1~~TRINITY_DN3054_c0_g1_i1.p1  ORF type:complete len:469 (-),score=134.49 TRINITY_DN3054_c0_g1_i1:18-1424(-)
MRKQDKNSNRWEPDPDAEGFIDDYGGSVGRSFFDEEPRRVATRFSWGTKAMIFSTFLSSISFSIVLSSIWHFIQKLNPNADYSMVGWAVAANSLGSFLSSPVLNVWADRRNTREVMVFCYVLMFVGNILYSFSENQWMLLASRVIVGISAGNTIVSQTYISYASQPESRTKVMSINSGASILGFVVGPALAFITTFFQFNIGKYAINELTTPGYVSAFLSLLGMASVLTLKEVDDEERRMSKIDRIRFSREKSLPWIPITITIALTFIFSASFTVFETIGTIYTQKAYGWTPEQNSIMYTLIGIVCIFSVVLLTPLMRLTSGRVLLFLMSCFGVSGFALLVDPQNVYVPLWRFGLGVSFAAACYTSAVALLISIYSKFLQGFDQGTLMGWVNSSGSVSRIVGPIFASYIMAHGGPVWIFGSMTGILSIALILSAVGLKHLHYNDVPLLKLTEDEELLLQIERDESEDF